MCRDNWFKVLPQTVCLLTFPSLGFSSRPDAAPHTPTLTNTIDGHLIKIRSIIKLALPFHLAVLFFCFGFFFLNCVFARPSVCLCCVCATCSLLLQALVKVDGGGLGAVLSYPLLQVFLQPAYTHGAAKKKLKKLKKLKKKKFGT